MTDAAVNEATRNAELYRLFALAFYPPAEGISVEPDILAALDALLADAGIDAGTPLGVIFAGESPDALAVDHAQLFVGPFELSAPPYGSVWLEEGRKVMGDTTVAAASYYAEAGLAVTEDFHEAPDHAVIELEFMHYVSANIAMLMNDGEHTAAENLRTLRAAFRKECMDPFFAPFLDAVVREADTAFYRELAARLAAFCELHPD